MLKMNRFANEWTRVLNIYASFLVFVVVVVFFSNFLAKQNLNTVKATNFAISALRLHHENWHRIVTDKFNKK